MDPAPRRGRRDNGLDAAAFVPLADVDPRVGEHLLDVLGAAGVPAYLEPSVDIEPYTRALALPSPPTDRLWVDREQRLAARQIVETEAEQAGQTGPGSPGRDRGGPAQQTEEPASAGLPADEELIWQQIVASYEADAADAADAPVPPWPVAEDGDGSATPDGAGGAADDDPDTRPRWRRGAAADPPGLDDPPAEEADEEEHFIPPPPPPVPRLSRQAVLALVLLLIGLALVFAPGQVGIDQQAGLLFGVVSILSGTGVLILRLRDSRSDDDPDDGAVV